MDFNVHAQIPKSLTPATPFEGLFKMSSQLTDFVTGEKTIQIIGKSNASEIFSKNVKGIIPSSQQKFKECFETRTLIPISLKEIKNKDENNISYKEVVFVSIDELAKMGIGLNKIDGLKKTLANESTNFNQKIYSINAQLNFALERMAFFEKIHDTLIEKWSEPIDDATLEKANVVLANLASVELNEEKSQVLLQGRVGGSLTIQSDPNTVNDWIRAESFVKELVKSKDDLTIDDICAINQLVNGEVESFGLRDHPVSVGDWGGVSYPDQKDVKDLINVIVKEINQGIKKGDNPIILGALAYQKMVSVHPFSDGNGRTCRLVMDYVLLKAGILPPVLKDVNLAIFGDQEGEDPNNATPSMAVEKIIMGIFRSHELVA
ncbi:MAG: Fic family protein [Candidatus Protochlamydia sp.]|nr:Fic family protein [Candidatus Protochlamydia sp.]